MCYFARTDFMCGDWRWGNMMERCPRQHRIGETCGAKLVHTDHIDKRSDPCKTCQEMEVKKRRLLKIEDNIRRWITEGDRFAASLDKARGEQDQLNEKIKELNSRRQSVVFRSGSDRSGQSLAALDNNTLSPLGTENSGSYTYSTQPRNYAAPGQYSSSGQLSSGYSNANAPARPSHRNNATPYSQRR